MDRVCNLGNEVRGRIRVYRPKTLRGILAALDFGAEHQDVCYWPEGAIEGLRALVERDGETLAQETAPG